MSLFDLMTSDDELDAIGIESLSSRAVEGPIFERTKALWALSRQVTIESLPQFIETLEDSALQTPLMFGTLPANQSVIIALLINSSGEVRLQAERLWFELSFAERHELKSYLRDDGFELPTLEVEDQALAEAVAVASERLGPAKWIASPLSNLPGISVREDHPGKKSLVVASDGSALLMPESGGSSAELKAFADGARSSDEDFERRRASG